MIKIDDNVPIFAKRLVRPSIYPFKEMGIGQSFLVPKGKQASVAVGCRNAKLAPRKFSVFKGEENGEIVYRCWRVE